MFDLTCSYLDDDDIDHEAEKQWIFKTLHKLEKEEEIKSLLNDFSKFSSLYDEAVAAGLKKSAVNDYIIISASAPDEVTGALKEYLRKTIYDAWGKTVSKSQMLRDFVSEYKWAHLDMETFDAMNRENFFNNIEL